MRKKKFAACVYLYRGKAVRNLMDLTIVETDPVRLAKYYGENNADELFVFDLSARAATEAAREDHLTGEEKARLADTLHEEALDIIREICSSAQVDVMGIGNIRRLEDVKKLLYAGCKRVVLNFENQSNISIAEEAAQRFGKDKLLAAYNDPEVLEANRESVERNVCALFLMTPHQIRETEEILPLPFYVQVNQVAFNKLMEIFTHENLRGVTGNTINDNVKDILSLKSIYKEAGIPVDLLDAAFQWADLEKNSDGLVPVVVQDYRTLEVLMVAYMNEEAYDRTLRTGRMTYFSRSRQELWIKGATSGNYQYLKSLTADCDLDTLLARVSQVGAACHTGAKSCFFNTVAEKEDGEEADPSNPLKVLESVFAVIKDRKEHPKEGSYTNYLFDKGLDKILKKLGEEATEIVIAAKNPNQNEVIYEISDFLYHMMVLMAEKDLSWGEITTELMNR